MTDYHRSIVTQHARHIWTHVFHDWRFDAAFLGSILATVAMLALAVVAGGPTPVDERLTLGIQGQPGTDAILRFASDLGGGVYGFYVAPAILAVILVALRQWRLLWLVGAVVALHYLLITPKLFIEAYRPSPLFGVEGAGGIESFPSGHVEWATSFYGLVGYLAVRARPSLRWPIIGAFAAIVLGTMLGRIELGRHWPIDTVAGLLMGLIAVRLLMRLHQVMECVRELRAGRPALAPIPISG